MMAHPIRDAESGDVLLYTQPNWLVSLKTWSRYTHVEMAFVHQTRGMRTFTSRLKTGVAFYAPDLTDLALVLRPKVRLDEVGAMRFAVSAVGQPYDLVGLCAFWVAALQGADNGAMFCSECVARTLRKGGVDLFPGADCDAIPPSYFAHNPLLDVVWRSADEWRLWQERQD